MWKSVKGYEGLYEVSDTGQVKRISRTCSDGRVLKERTLKGGKYPNGYLFVCFRKEGENKNHLIHRLVAQTFIPNPDNLPEVNHINGIKTDNRVENLEWCDRKYNLQHAIDIGLVENRCKIRRKVIVTFEGNKQIIFPSMKNCAKFFGYKQGWLHNKIRKFGCTFEFRGYLIEVQERM